MPRREPDQQSTMRVLCLNAGSSSLRSAAFVVDPDPGEPLRVDSQVVERVGEPSGPDHLTALEAVSEALDRQGFRPDVIAHRLVHAGPEATDHALLDERLRANVEAAVSFAPLHLPAALAVVDAASARHPGVVHVACLDSAFHRHLPAVARRLPVPGALDAAGIRRYGFHGLSYEYLVHRLGPALGRRAVLAHLGNGASLAAVLDGVGVDTTMGFTPTSGLVMGTRTGDLDPGVLVHLVRTGGLDPDRLEHLVDRESGLLGVSGRSGDVRDLLVARDVDDPGATLALEVYESVAAKHVAALTTVLGGLDTLVFTAGVGEHAAPVRAGIAARLAHLGVRLDPEANASGAAIVSEPSALVTVRVERTDEESMMARHAARLTASDARDAM